MAIVYLWYSVPNSVHCSRASDLPRLGLARDPAGVALAAPNSARTTSRPVTRTSRRTGDLPPTPHHVLGRGGRSCPLEPHPSPDAAGPTGVSGDSDTLTKGKTRQGCQRPSRLMSTRPLRHVTTRPSRLMNRRPSCLMCTRPSRLKISCPSRLMTLRPRAFTSGPLCRELEIQVWKTHLMTTRPSRLITTWPSRLMTTRPEPYDHTALALSPRAPLCR
jgi:hypothetical protein